MSTGSHVAGWRYPGAIDSFVDLAAIKQIGETAERGLFDLIFMGDNLYGDPAAHPSYTLRFEPLTLLSALAMSTKYIGLGATVSTTYSDPFTVARAFASLDCLSAGRAAWNVVTTQTPAAAANFGTAHPNHAARYEMAGEFVDVVKGLWDGWDDDAIVKDRISGLYIDASKVKPLDHDGRFYKVKGPLNIGRTPQGHPVILQAGGSEAGTDLAARTADVVFSVVQDFDEAKSAYAALKAKVIQCGRNPHDVIVLPGVMPVVGRTNREAQDKLNQLQDYVGIGSALTMLSERFGTDMSVYELDAPFPEVSLADTYHSFTQVLIAKAKREQLTLRDVCSLTAAARGHWVLAGSPETIADTLEHWFMNGAADGFNIMPPYFHEGFEDFVDLVVPILQKRGLYPEAYAGTMLRDNLGLARVKKETSLR